MSTFNGFNFFKTAISAVFGLLLTATAAQATPMVGDIINGSGDGGSYSLIHLGAGASGSGDRGNWWHFDAGQKLLIDLAGTNVSLLTGFGPQIFNLKTTNGATGSVEFTGLNLDLNDTDGFLNGTLDYVLDGTAGQFIFTNHNMTSIFNTSSLVGDMFSFYLWGGDASNQLGIDLAFVGNITDPVVSSSGGQVPVPAPALLMLLGLAALSVSRRRA